MSNDDIARKVYYALARDHLVQGALSAIQNMMYDAWKDLRTHKDK